MKIENLITQYLLIHKSISLQEIGILRLHQDISEGTEAASIPEGAISFEFNLKAPADEGFVNFVMEKTRKIRPLASSDIESYMMLGKQFLNIGKPFVIKDLGVLLKNQQHVYEFSLGQTSASKIESTDTVIIEKEISTGEIDFSSPRISQNHKRKWLPWLMISLFLVIVIILYFSFRGNEKNVETISNDSTTAAPVTNITDTSKQSVSINQSLTDSAKNTATALASDSFFVVVRTSNKLAEITKWYEKLSSYPIGKGLILYTNDSIMYKIAMPIHLPLSDTTHVKDSFKVNFGKAVIELNK